MSEGSEATPFPVEPSGPLGPAELDEFLAGSWLCKLACLRPDGWPYVIPLWYVWQDRKVYVIGRERAAWIAYLRADSQVSLVIDEEAARHRRVQMRGHAAIVEGPVSLAGRSERWRRVAATMTARYMADARGQAYARRTAERPRYLVEIEPLEIVSWRGGEWHPRYYR